MKILVAGATGNVGPTLVAHLLRAGENVRVLARDPEKATRLLGPDVEVVRGNLGEPAALTSALRGVDRAFLATAPTPTLAEEEINFIDAGQAAGLERLVKLSGFGIEFSSDRIHRNHARSEQRLRASGIPSVVLRPVVFMSNLLFDATATSARAGKYEVTDDVVRNVLGRPASNLADWVARHRDAFTPLARQ